MGNLCIIPARGGSKRIPRKNIRDFLGKPIIAYSIETALASGLFDEVMVSTDDEEIATVARDYGARVPFMRSPDTADDFAGLADVVDDVKAEYQLLNRRFDYICCLLPTAPMVTPEIILRGFDELSKLGGAGSVRPVVRFNYPIQRALKITNGGKMSFLYPEHTTTRSQDLEPAFHDAGLLYWMRFEAGLRGENKYAFEITSDLAHDIDTEEDWRLAELKYKVNFNI